MSVVLDLLTATIFGAAAIAIARLDRRRNERDQVVAWILGGICTLLVIASVAYSGEPNSLLRGLGSAIALGLLPLGAWMIHRDGIDPIDVVVSCFAGFVLGVTSWGLAWNVMIGSAAVAGLLAFTNLVRKGESSRVSFAYIVAGLAFAAAAGTALTG